MIDWPASNHSRSIDRYGLRKIYDGLSRAFRSGLAFGGAEHYACSRAGPGATSP